MVMLTLHCEPTAEYAVEGEFGSTSLKYAQVIGMTVLRDRISLSMRDAIEGDQNVSVELPDPMAQNICAFFKEFKGYMYQPPKVAPPFDAGTFTANASGIVSREAAHFNFFRRDIAGPPYMLESGCIYGVMRNEHIVHSMIGLGSHKRTLSVLGSDAVLAVASPEALLEAYKGQSINRVLVRPRGA